MNGWSWDDRLAAPEVYSFDPVAATDAEKKRCTTTIATIGMREMKSAAAKIRP